MSRHTNPSNETTHAFNKAAALTEDDARQEAIDVLDRIANNCQRWLVANGHLLEHGPTPDMSDVKFVDHTRQLDIHVNIPASLPILESLKDVYEAEGDLLNSTQRALMEHHLRFDGNPNDPGYFSVEEQNMAMQAMAAKLRADTDELTRRTYAVYDSGPAETHRVMITNDDEELLQQWAEKRGPPNEAEIHMLAEYIGVDVFNIYDWFKAKGLQTKAISLMLGEAFSHSQAFRKIGVLRFRAAQVQTAWLRKLTRLREEHERAQRDTAGRKACQDSINVPSRKGETEHKRLSGISMREICGEMKPFIDFSMD